MPNHLWHQLLNRLGLIRPCHALRRRSATFVPSQLELLENRSLLSVSFQSAVTYGVGTYPTFSSVGDFNDDGKVDLAVANNQSNNVGIMLGNGNGTFQAPINYPVTSPFTITVGDFNHDAIADLVIPNTYFPSTTISVLLGNGNGSFQNAVSYSTGTAPAYTPYSVALGDFNTDGNTDLAVSLGADENGANNVSILLGNGNGTFQSAVHYASGGSTSSLVAEDFNGDGKTDLAVANGSANFQGAVNTIGILLGNGDGTFQSPAIYASNGPTKLAKGDFNGDGRMDLAVAHGNNTVGILLGNGNGTFQNELNYATGLSGGQGVAVADFDGDGKSDLVVANFYNNVSILQGNGNGTFQSPILVPASNPYSVTVGDFNSDGKPDLAVPDFANNILSILLNNSTPPNLTAQQRIAVVKEQVNALVATNVLSSGNGNSLISKLDAASASLDRGNKNAGINQLNAFINQVNALKKSSKLNNAISQTLIDLTNEAILSVNMS